ncbi:MAG: hypothetical protein KC422_01780 [Trueperaceae bacterium]|nr:hypothetical protein [Trueperaceae bacterium]
MSLSRVLPKLARYLLIMLAGTAILLSACVPTTANPDSGERVEVAQLTDTITYYPHQVGAEWRYLEENVPLESMPLVQRIDGPTIIDGDLWVKSRLEGQGIEIFTYRQFRPDGVFLLRTDKPGTEITFDPPIQQFPAENTLKTGASWSGDTTAHLFFPDAVAENQNDELPIHYVYTVVDQRKVTSPAGAFDVFVINFVTRNLDEQGATVQEFSQEIWFSPFVGEVRTEQGYYLVSTNVTETQE